MECYHNENILLKSSRLSVEIASPGTFYNRSRFDWNGFITQVTLDDVHTFCVPESLIDGQGSGGCGLCGEFGILEPIGYDEAPVGGCFPKIGVGDLLKQDNLEYDFLRDYELHPCKASITRSESRVEFITAAPDCGGYSFLYKKTVFIEHSFLKIEYYLKNTGLKTLSTTEYCHNFIRIDREATGSDYILKLPYKPDLKIIREGMEPVSFNEITWKNKGWTDAFYAFITGYNPKKSHEWDLYNKKVRAGVRETNDFSPCRFAVWGMKHVISPEIFIKINLNPGEEMRWTRAYEFYNK